MLDIAIQGTVIRLSKSNQERALHMSEIASIGHRQDLIKDYDYYGPRGIERSNMQMQPAKDPEYKDLYFIQFKLPNVFTDNYRMVYLPDKEVYNQLLN